MREAFSTSPLKITCDNMIILYDQTKISPNLIWDDDNETVMAFRINTGENQNSCPFEIFMTEYEHIQYIEALTTPAVAKEWVDQNVTDATQKELVEKVFQDTIGKRSYTGTTPMRNVYNNNDTLL